MPVLASSQVYGKTSSGTDVAIGATNPTSATGGLTFTGQPANGETITVGPFTYIWTNVAANATGQVPYYVLIGTNTAASITNLAAAINGSVGRGTQFSNLTVPNPLATAVATSGTVLTVTATNAGADGNGFQTLSGTALATWGGAITSGGASASLQVTGPGGGGIPIAPATGAPTVLSEVASSTTIIPAGAFDIGILILTGTGTINGVTWPANTPFNFTDKTSGTITLILGNPGTAIINYLS